MVEYLSSKWKVPSSNPSTKKEIKTRFCPSALSSLYVTEDRVLEAILYKRKSLKVKNQVTVSLLSEF
jgi:hypothetical protein